jgi:hypothetical protein
MWEQFQRYRALDPDARKLFRSVFVLLPLIRIHLRSRGYRKTQLWLQQRLEQRIVSTISLPQEDAIAVTCRMVKSATHYGFIRPTCLEESLALWYFLREKGILPNLRIGVRKNGEKFEAHAWVEHEGATLNQVQEAHKHYAAFDSEFAERPSGLP